MLTWEILQKNGNFELYLILFLLLFTIWFIYATIHHYKAEKRKIKHLHRFAKEGEVESQSKLADKYHIGEMVKKDSEKAAFWYQRAAFNGDMVAKEKLQIFLNKRKKQKNVNKNIYSV